MQTSYYTAYSGMFELNRGFEVISNNISNINTVGFKKSEVRFEDLFSMTNKLATSNTNPLQKGHGVATASIVQNFSQGSIKETGNTFDMAINGQGFFMVMTDKDEILYTRAGHFLLDAGRSNTATGDPVFDAEGNLLYFLSRPDTEVPVSIVDPSTGHKLQGWLADANGNIDSSQEAANLEFDYETIKVLQFEPTTYTDYWGNLDSDAEKVYARAAVKNEEEIFRFSTVPSDSVSLKTEPIYDESGYPLKVYMDRTSNGVFEEVPENSVNGYTIGRTVFDGSTGINADSPTGGDLNSVTVTPYAEVDDWILTFSSPTEFEIEGVITGPVAGGPFDINNVNTIEGITFDPAEWSGIFAAGNTVRFSTLKEVDNRITFHGTYTPNKADTVKAGYYYGDINDSIISEVRGLPENYGAGDFIFDIGADGSAKMTYYGENGSKETTNFAAGTITAGGTNYDLVKGLAITFGADIEGKTVIETSGGSAIGRKRADASVYDSNGKHHILKIYFDKQDTNNWEYEAFLEITDEFTKEGASQEFTLSDEAEPGSVRIYVNDEFYPLGERFFTHSGADIEIIDRTLKEGSKIKIVYDAARSISQNNLGTLDFDANGQIEGGDSSVSLSFGPGNPVNISLSLDQIVQFAGYSNAEIYEADGHPDTPLTGINVNDRGFITAAYNYGNYKVLGQVALANFINPQGLYKDGGNYYKPSANSGDAQITAPGTSNAGSIISRNLEMSNVDLADTMSEVLVLQRAYQFNSKSFTTQDEMTQNAINLKR